MSIQINTVNLNPGKKVKAVNFIKYTICEDRILYLYKCIKNNN